MDVRLSRLRRGEITAGLSAIALLVLLFAVPWFRIGPAGVTPAGPRRYYTYPRLIGIHTDANGWNSLPALRWLIVVVGISGVLLAVFQAARAAPAVPVSWSVIVTTLAAIMTLLLIIRLPTDAGSPLVGAYLGLLVAAVLTAGAFRSLREEDGWVPDGNHPIETIALGPPTRP